jgi:hypothetical protein
MVKVDFVFLLWLQLLLRKFNLEVKYQLQIALASVQQEQSTLQPNMSIAIERELIRQRPSGMLPLSMLPSSAMLFKFISDPIDCGMVPDNWLLDKSRLRSN